MTDERMAKVVHDYFWRLGIGCMIMHESSPEKWFVSTCSFHPGRLLTLDDGLCEMLMGKTGSLPEDIRRRLARDEAALQLELFPAAGEGVRITMRPVLKKTGERIRIRDYDDGVPPGLDMEGFARVFWEGRHG
jgi:hypothetical protein